MGKFETPQHGWIGRSLPREETRRLVAGGGRYVDDIACRGELHAAFLRSPYPQAEFTLDVTAAQQVPGVAAVLVAADLAPICGPLICPDLVFPGMVSPPQFPLAAGRAVYQGEPLALVLAESRAVAEDAVELIAAEWRECPAVTRLDRALMADAPPVHPGLASNLGWSTTIGAEVGDAFAEAALVVEATLDFARNTGVTLEPRGLIAQWDAATGALDLRISHQMPHQVQLHMAELFGVPIARVRVVCGDVGGGFGLKMHIYQDELAAIAAARLVRRPVRFIADRMESLMADIHAREHRITGRMAVDVQGRIIGFDIDDLHGMGAYSVFPRSSTREAMSALAVIGAPYLHRAFHARLRCALQNKMPTGQLRAVGNPIGCAITERLVDLAATARGEDRLAFRARNLLPAEMQPWTSPSGFRLFGLSHHRCLERLRQLMDLPALEAEIAAGRAQGRWLGLGFASLVEFTAPNSRSYGPTGAPVAAVDAVVATLEMDGSISLRASVAEIGQGIRQSLAQVMADAMGVAADAVTVQTGDTATVPHGGGAWASRGAAIGGEAAWQAGVALRGQILNIAAALLQAQISDLDIQSGQVIDRSGATRISLGELARITTLQNYLLPDGTDAQLSVSRSYRRESDASLPNNGIQAALVEIDPDTGHIRVLRHFVVFDCGRVINPLLVEEQIRGGVVMGLGQALLESCAYDGGGQFISATLADYKVPMADDAPDIAIALVQTPYAGSAVGAKGAGEAGACAAPAAILNAVNDALAGQGASVSAFPITPLDVLRALGKVPPA